ncbi:hypothetical protein [Clostridium sp.]|uniref:hypothetical protein n=1 Tax=Clostridium sp. TaxID=1506 RepID=UPI003D6C8186
MIQINKLLDNEQKSNITNSILRKLPEWFGIEETREFYKNVGFCPLEEIKEIWGDKNPCLIMVKTI